MPNWLLILPHLISHYICVVQSSLCVPSKYWGCTTAGAITHPPTTTNPISLDGSSITPRRSLPFISFWWSNSFDGRRKNQGHVVDRAVRIVIHRALVMVNEYMVQCPQSDGVPHEAGIHITSTLRCGQTGWQPCGRPDGVCITSSVIIVHIVCRFGVF